MDETGSTELERLAAKVAELEHRLSQLEQRGTLGAPGLGAPVPIPFLPSRAPAREGAAPSLSSFAIAGRAVLGMAGAYLLRAASEAEVLPKLVVVAAAVFYGWSWQLLAARAAKRSRLAGTVYGITSVLILFPLLWESTVRFHILAPAVTAAALVLWLASAFLLARGPEFSPTVWATALLGCGTALGLYVATEDPLPFVLSLCLLAALAEYAACREKWPGLRVLTAAALDLGLCSLLFLAARPKGFPEGYRPIGVSALLALFTLAPLIGACGVAYRTIRRNRTIAIRDMAQTVVSFVLLLAAVVVLGGTAAAVTFGLFGFLATAIGYLEAFFNKSIGSKPRNFFFYSTWAGALFVVSSCLVLPASARLVWLGLSAVVVTALAVKSRRLSLAIHGLGWLIAAQISSHLLVYAGQLFAGGYPFLAPHLSWLVAACATLTTVLLLLPPWEARGIHVLRCASVVLTVFLLGAFAVSGIVTIFERVNPATAPRLALIRTVVISVVTLGLALGRSWRNRKELLWAAYIVLGLGTLKLVLEDLRVGSTATFAFSLLVFGVLLAVIPRLTRADLFAEEPAVPAGPRRPEGVPEEHPVAEIKQNLG